MSEDRFLYCRDCNAVHHLTPFDNAPVYEFQDRTVREIRADDRRSFLKRHTGHRLEELTSLIEEHFRSAQFFDPMKIGYIEASNGTESFILRSSRRTVAEPLTYEVMPRQLKLWQIGGAAAIEKDFSNSENGLSARAKTRPRRKRSRKKIDQPALFGDDSSAV